jgi:AIG1 family
MAFFTSTVPLGPLSPPSQVVSDSVALVGTVTKTVYIWVYGLTGAGKSDTLGAILRALGCYSADDAARHFVVGDGISSETGTVRELRFCVAGVTYVLRDIPGLMDTAGQDVQQQREVAKRHVKEGNCHAILYVMKSGRITSVDKAALALFREFYGDGIATHGHLIITHGDLFGSADAEQRFRTEAITACTSALGAAFTGTQVVSLHPERSTPTGRGLGESGEALLKAINDRVLVNHGSTFKAKALATVTVQPVIRVAVPPKKSQFVETRNAVTSILSFGLF